MSQTVDRNTARPVSVEAPMDASTLADVRFAIDNGYEYAKTVANHLARRMHPVPDLSGLTIAELGTPDRFGPMLFCRAMGARIAAVNTHFVKWDKKAPAFLRALGQVGREEYPDADWSWIESVIESGTYETSALALHSVESLSGPMAIDDASFDCIVTNAILNQVDLPALMRELGRITRPSGFGIHQIDFRDTVDYSYPLEFLTLSDADVEKQKAAGRWSRGNRLRPIEMQHIFRRIGFRVEHFGPNMNAGDACLQALRPRLAPRYAAMSDEELRPISGRFYLRAITDAQVREDVDYAIRIAREYVELILRELGRNASASMPLADLDLLELGPGRHFGTPLVLHAFGARVAVLDKYLADWDEVYHPRFYRFMREALAERLPDRDWSAVDRIIAATDHLPEIVAQDRTDLAHPPSGYAEASFDVIVSNAVLEHVGDVPQTAAEMARLTRPGGINIHQVDFRDHRDFEHPLEFLTMAGDAYQKLFDETMNGNGNRVRPEDMGNDFRSVGFDVLRFDANIWAEPEHIEAVRPRLQSQFAALSNETLAVISGRFFLRRQGKPETPPANSHKKYVETDLQEDRWAVEGAVDEHVRYAIVNGVYYASAIARQFDRGILRGANDQDSSPYGLLSDLGGLAVLELGPGPNFGSMLVAAACGAQAAVLDKYLATWGAQYHPKFYRALLNACQVHFPYANWTPLKRIVDGNSHLPEVIQTASADLAEPPSSYRDGAFDAIVSNAVLEHIGDTAAMARELARLTKPGGIGVHQVDFRDHEKQDQPLTFLTVPQNEFVAHFIRSRNSQGNRVRAHELADDFIAGGFEIDAVEPNLFATAEHMAEMRPRLIQRFAAMSDEQLMTVSARLFVRKQAADDAAESESEPDAIGTVFAQPRADHTAHIASADDEFTECINDQIGYCLRNAIDYAYCIGQHFGRFTDTVPDYNKVRVLEDIPDLSGLSVLELGPGRNFGSMLVCHAMGAEVAVLDKYLAKWDSSYHPAFYAKLRQVGQQRLPRAKWDAIDAILASGKHRGHVISQHGCDLATPPSDLPDASFDVIVSNAVLEHVGDTFMTACELARLTRPGGLGVHQVDYRDHRNFDRPFDFLRFEEEEYRRLFLSSRNENGNRVRSHELVEDFRRAGFEIPRVDENLFASPDQLAEVRAQLNPRFAAMTDSELLVLSSRLFLRRTNQPIPTGVFPKRSAIGAFVKRLVQ